MAEIILAIDQGTTGSTVAAMDRRGRLLGSVNVEFPQLYPRPGWVEHDPEQIWTSVQKALSGLLRRGVAKPKDIVAIGITNQRETTILWRRSDGAPCGPALVWQDGRTADVAALGRGRRSR